MRISVCMATYNGEQFVQEQVASILSQMGDDDELIGIDDCSRDGTVDVVTPIPAFVESHDLWIALASNLFRSNAHLDDQTLHKRKHGNNATSTVSSRSLYRKLRSRLIFAASVVVLLSRRSRRSRVRFSVTPD